VEWANRSVNDLAFFNNKDGEITHVGVLTSRKKIVHASGEVRIDNLTEEGIIHTETGELTHKLSHLMRVSKLED
jgi:cell wall-associated NlpC family hydrolase